MLSSYDTAVLGTLALAFFTRESVRRTDDVIQGEERRHQQSFAPLIDCIGAEVVESLVQVRLNNAGGGLALNLAIRVFGNWSSKEFRPQVSPLTPWPDVEAEYSTLVSVVPLRHDYAVKKVTMSGASPEKHYTVFTALQVFMSYEDAFGNSYSSVYDDFSTGLLNWKRPTALTNTRLSKI